MFKNHKNIKNSITFVLKIFITFLILYLIFLKIDFRNFSLVSSRISYFYILLAFLVYFLQFLISTIKWQKLVEFFGVKLNFYFYLKFNFISLFYATIMPGGLIAGDLIKGYKIFKISKDRKIIMNSILMDRMTGFLGLIILIISLFFLFLRSLKFPNYPKMVLIAVFLLLLIIVFLIFSKKIINYLFKIVKRVFPKSEILLEKVSKTINTYSDNPALLIFAILIGILIYLVNTICVYLTAMAIGINVSFINILAVNCLANFAVIVAPITFSGFGIREGSFIYFLSFAGVAKEPVLILSLVLGFIYLLLSLGGGLLEARTLFVKK